MPSATQIQAPATCPNCAADLPPDSDHCPACGRLLSPRSTKITVAVLLVLILAGFAFTQWFVQLHRITELDLAHRWFTRGDQAMQANLPKVAADDFRTALNYERSNNQFRLRLAQALLAENRFAESRAHLLSLWEQEPAAGEVNLTLARLEARRGHNNEAVRYYNNAINGVWHEDPRERRIATRFELARFFISQQQPARAQSELLALLADAPSSPADQLLLGQMLLETNESGHALQAYSALLAKDPHNAQAWLGVSQAQVALGNYTEAERAASKAVADDANLPDAKQQLQLAREILDIAPGLRGLALSNRTERVAKAFATSFARLTTCATEQHVDLAAAASAGSSGSTAVSAANSPAPSTLQLLYISGLQKQPEATAARLRSDPDALEPTMQYVFEVERATAALCPVTSATDLALLTLAGHESETTK